MDQLHKELYRRIFLRACKIEDDKLMSFILQHYPDCNDKRSMVWEGIKIAGKHEDIELLRHLLPYVINETYLDHPNDNYPEN